MEDKCCSTCKWCVITSFGLGGYRERYCDYTRSRLCTCSVGPETTCEKWEPIRKEIG